MKIIFTLLLALIKFPFSLATKTATEITGDKTLTSSELANKSADEVIAWFK